MENEKECLFWDPEKKDLSEEALWFIGGILKHTDALVALCCPTPVCYDRLKRHSFAPCNATWGEENRSAFIRTKKQNNTHC
eukprot:UN33335